MIWGCEIRSRWTWGSLGRCEEGWERYLPFVSGICAGSIVGEGLGASKFVVRRGGGDDVALGGDLAGETGDGTGHFRVSDGLITESVWVGGRKGKQVS